MNPLHSVPPTLFSQEQQGISLFERLLEYYETSKYSYPTSHGLKCRCTPKECPLWEDLSSVLCTLEPLREFPRVAPMSLVQALRVTIRQYSSAYPLAHEMYLFLWFHLSPQTRHVYTPRHKQVLIECEASNLQGCVKPAPLMDASPSRTPTSPPTKKRPCPLEGTPTLMMSDEEDFGEKDTPKRFCERDETKTVELDSMGRLYVTNVLKDLLLHLNLTEYGCRVSWVAPYVVRDTIGYGLEVQELDHPSFNNFDTGIFNELVYQSALQKGVQYSKEELRFLDCQEVHETSTASPHTIYS